MDRKIEIKACKIYKRDVGMATIDKFFDEFSFPRGDMDTSHIREASKGVYAAFLRRTVSKYSGCRSSIHAAACIYIAAIHMGNYITLGQLHNILPGSKKSISRGRRIVLHEICDDYPELEYINSI